MAGFARSRATQTVTAPDAADSASPTPPQDRLVVRKLNREFILNCAEIDRLEADGNYVLVHAAGQNYRLRESLDGLARRLGEQRFARVHRTHVVNIDRIREIQPWDHGDFRIVLKDGNFVNFSRRYRNRLDQRSADLSSPCQRRSSQASAATPQGGWRCEAVEPRVADPGLRRTPMMRAVPVLSCAVAPVL